LIEGLTLLGQGGQALGIGDKSVPTDLFAMKGAEHRFISRTKKDGSGVHISGKFGRFSAPLRCDLSQTAFVLTWDLQITREFVTRNRSNATASVILSER
jgi:hypothetical protein